ncbi:MAG TPA: hypothetical protein VGV41_15980 [Pseudolabrys sp.]|uniref:hypothetical protein n=1 Tax=Pseudolabrys sp. TaxID=1960880 RepID=UPI002DDCA856|nr:hypothetical protein [Pseudolabrys sp.]HEV2630133.1 hypothetical protein [Pseudolabrys sp.]
MTDSASLKIDRAANHARELIKLLNENRPFSYVLETNTQTRKRATFAKKNEAVVMEAAVICGDIVHNLRTALDHAFWQIVSPYVSEHEERTVQFPFCREPHRLDTAIEQRFANRVSTRFVDALRSLRPHTNKGGNHYLWFVHEFDLGDKHRLLIPIGDYTFLSGADIRRQGVPDFPFHAQVHFGENERDVTWDYTGPIPSDRLGSPSSSAPHLFERELQVAVEAVFPIRVEINRPLTPVIQTINRMRLATSEAVSKVREAVS